MNAKATIRPISVALIAVLALSATLFLALQMGAGSALQILPRAQDDLNRTAGVEAGEYAYAQDITAMRWQAMARYYEAQGLLTRDESAVNDAAFLARNPELSTAARYAVDQADASYDAAFLARNPELSAAARYAAAHNAD